MTFLWEQDMVRSWDEFKNGWILLHAVDDLMSLTF